MKTEAVLRPTRHVLLNAVAATMMAVAVGIVTSGRVVAQDWGQPVWSDEFDGRSGAAPDPAKWTYDVGDLHVNNELEIYCSPASASAPCDPSVPNAFQDGGGRLVVQAVKSRSGTWTSARLKTQGLESFQYGRIEAGMRLPVAPGLWPAFWMLGDDITTTGWPQCGEIDFMENVPITAGLGPTTIRSTLHGPGYSGSAGLGQSYTLANGGRVDTAFHTYGAIWSPYMVQFYVDDPRNVFFVRTARDVPAGSTWVYDHGFFAILNLAVGGDWPGPPDASTPSPSPMLVDYVRVYHASTILGPVLQAPAITVKSGASATASVDAVAARGAGRMYLACTGAPAQATCSLNPYVVDFSDTAEVSTAVTVATRPTAVALGSNVGAGGMAAAVVALALVPRLRRKRRSAWMVAGALLLISFVAGACGGGGGAPSTGQSGTPAGSYTLTITAYTVSGDSSSVGIPLTVTP
jgi:beta-glucanase (GH16 family)